MNAFQMDVGNEKKILYPYKLIICTVLLFRLATYFNYGQCSTAHAAAGTTDLDEFKAYADKFFSQNMDKYHIPGAVVSVVKNGSVFLQKGYGYANIEKKTPMTPDNTVFRIGSVSKLITSTAVMQLLEQGRIDLNKDVNEYLKKFKVEQKFSKPVTTFNLLTHTGLFVSTNGPGGWKFCYEFVEGFIDRYYPASRESSSTIKYNKGLNDIKQVAGTYRSIRYGRKTLDKLILLLSPQIRVKAEEGVIIVNESGKQQKYMQVDEMLFKNMENGRYMAFIRDNDGKVTHMSNEVPIYAFEKLNWLESSTLHIAMFGVFILVFLSATLYYLVLPVMSFIRRRSRYFTEPAFYARVLAAFISLSNIIFIVGFVLAVITMDSVSDIGFFLPPILKVLLFVQAITAILSAAMVIIMQFSISVH